ncbi:hypothetical protein B5807_07364 [Epicoccum nigrum]|uniref:Uncharacterized protein n=1 Tax=Epicoccum nigrum TaxID=105696 RepID=A0A1Y2LXK6_EPING|nr:hypothetical protein B5807_07364 [Epicoccum nigrum]
MTTTTLAPVTTTNTATITAPPSTSVVATSTSTSTITATETDTISITATVTTTTTSTLTQTTTVTATTTVAPTYNGPSCNDPNDVLGGGGCSSNCYCDARAQNSALGVCDNQVMCLNNCQSDADCAAGYACITGQAAQPCGGSSCVSYTDCTSTFQKRGFLDNAAIDILKFRDVSPNPGAALLLRPQLE